MEILDDPERQVIASEAVRLEVMPKSIYEKRQEERAAFDEIFQKSEMLSWKLEVLRKAYDLACRYGIAALDAIHLAFAVDAQVDEFVTAEKPTKSLFRFNQAGTKPRIHSLQER